MVTRTRSLPDPVACDRLDVPADAKPKSKPAPSRRALATPGYILREGDEVQLFCADARGQLLQVGVADRLIELPAICSRPSPRTTPKGWQEFRSPDRRRVPPDVVRIRRCG